MVEELVLLLREQVARAVLRTSQNHSEGCTQGSAGFKEEVRQYTGWWTALTTLSWRQSAPRLLHVADDRWPHLALPGQTGTAYLYIGRKEALKPVKLAVDGAQQLETVGPDGTHLCTGLNQRHDHTPTCGKRAARTALFTCMNRRTRQKVGVGVK